MRGRRATQEDTFLIQTELHVGDSTQVIDGHALFAIFDGHGTSFASTFASNHFISTFCNQKSFVEYCIRFLDRASNNTSACRSKKKCNMSRERNNSKLLKEAVEATMLALDARMLEEMTSVQEKNGLQLSAEEFDILDAGTTAIVIILTPSDIVCANLGDSRAIIHRTENNNQKRTISLSTDHKPSNKGEEERINKAGGVVLGGKIDARLAVSRVLGDFEFKHKQSVLDAAATTVRNNDETPQNDYVEPDDQVVSSVPETMTLPKDDERDKFLVLASDGIWDVISNDKCADLISSIFQEGEQSVPLACEELLDQCYMKGSLDNMTAILIRFASQEIGCGGGVMKRRKQRKKN